MAARQPSVALICIQSDMASMRSTSECERCIGECEWYIDGCDVHGGVWVVLE